MDAFAEALVGSCGAFGSGLGEIYGFGYDNGEETLHGAGKATTTCHDEAFSDRRRRNEPPGPSYGLFTGYSVYFLL